MHKYIRTSIVYPSLRTAEHENSKPCVHEPHGSHMDLLVGLNAAGGTIDALVLLRQCAGDDARVLSGCATRVEPFATGAH